MTVTSKALAAAVVKYCQGCLKIHQPWSSTELDRLICTPVCVCSLVLVHVRKQELICHKPNLFSAAGAPSTSCACKRSHSAFVLLPSLHRFTECCDCRKGLYCRCSIYSFWRTDVPSWPVQVMQMVVSHSSCSEILETAAHTNLWKKKSLGHLFKSEVMLVLEACSNLDSLLRVCHCALCCLHICGFI